MSKLKERIKELTDFFVLYLVNLRSHVAIGPTGQCGSACLCFLLVSIPFVLDNKRGQGGGWGGWSSYFQWLWATRMGSQMLLKAMKHSENASHNQSKQSPLFWHGYRGDLRPNHSKHVVAFQYKQAWSSICIVFFDIKLINKTNDIMIVYNTTLWMSKLCVDTNQWFCS